MASHFQEPTNAASTKWHIHLLLLEAPISAQATTYRMKLTTGGWRWQWKQKMFIDPLRLALNIFWEKSYLKEGLYTYNA